MSVRRATNNKYPQKISSKARTYLHVHCRSCCYTPYKKTRCLCKVPMKCLKVTQVDSCTAIGVTV